MKKVQKTKKRKLSLVQKIIVCVIAIIFVLIFFFLIFSLINNPERSVKSKIDNLARDYYENFLYEQITHTNNQTPAKALEEYKSVGLSIVYLRQLLYNKNQNDEETIKYLTNYCDENDTIIKYYPEPPYQKDSYRVEYSYSCDF